MHVKMSQLWPKTSYINGQNWQLISVCVLHLSLRLRFASTHFTKCVKTFACFKFFAINFQNQYTTKFPPYSTIRIFDFGVAKNLAAKSKAFRIFLKIESIEIYHILCIFGIVHLKLSIYFVPIFRKEKKICYD